MQLDDIKFAVLLENNKLRSTLTHLLRHQGAIVHCVESHNELRNLAQIMEIDMAILKVDAMPGLFSEN